MKIRILGNSLRLRLSQTDVSNLSEDLHVSDSINFGRRKLIYAVQGSDVPEVRASFSGDIITVDVPENQVREWCGSEQVGFENDHLVDGGESLHILVEKDFVCLNKREGEEDMFPNPGRSQV